ncbi:GGDEF/EAL domain-containing response regulator [Porticoccus sp.]
MASDNALKLLLVHDSFEEANRIVSLLRNANYRAESKHVDQEDVLSKLLQDKPWDLIIGQASNTKLPVKAIFSLIRRLNTDTPVILISDENRPQDIVEGLRLGAADVIPMDEDQHLLLVVARTRYDLEQRRRLRNFRRRYAESESRCERLLSSSVDAIAIVQEGTYLFVNDSYAQLFGHLEGDNMSCLPVLDTIAREDHPRLKEYLRPIEENEDIYAKHLTFTGITNDRIPVPIEARIAKVDYQGEPALEFLISREFLDGATSNLEGILTDDGNAISIQRDKVIEIINIAIRQAAQKHNSSIMLYITLDNYLNTLSEIGIQNTEQLISQLVEKINEENQQGFPFMRFKEDTFVMIMQSTGADAGLHYATHLCESIVASIFELEDRTYTLTLGIGATVISETVTTAEGCIDRALSALNELYQANDARFANGAKLYESEIGHEFCEEDLTDSARAMLEGKQFELFYQPVIPLQGTKEEFYEVLLHTKEGPQTTSLPENFIAKVFKTTVAAEIDRWVILEALKNLTETLKRAPNTRLFINISSQTICDEGFISWLKVALKASNLSPRQVIFQLREIDLARQFNRSVELISELSKINGDVALSHFGLAIEPMTLLHKLSVNYVKFDSVIIEKAYQSEESLEEVENLIGQLKGAEEKIIVPFVERADMIPTLWTCGVHYIQGHFLQPPSRQMDYDFNTDD